VLDISSKLSWIVCVAGDGDLHWVLVDHGAASGGASFAQQPVAGHHLGHWTEALLHCVVLVELDVHLDWTVSLTQTLGGGLVIIVTFSRVQQDWFVFVLAGLDVEQALAVKCFLWTWSCSTTDWVDDLTGRLWWAVHWIICFWVGASDEAGSVLFELIWCWLSGLLLILRWDLLSVSELNTNTTVSRHKLAQTEGCPLLKDWLVFHKIVWIVVSIVIIMAMVTCCHVV